MCRLTKVAGSSEITIFLPSQDAKFAAPFYRYPVSAGTTGFPSPADDFIESVLDLNKYFGAPKSSIFFARAEGESMTDAKIDHNDLLVIDRALSIRDENDIVVCCLEGSLAAKRIAKKTDGYYLVSANHRFKPVRIPEDDQLIIWGVVTGIIKKLRD